MIERTTVRLPSALLDQARRKAAADGRTLTALIEDGLRLVVSKGSAERKRVRLPPVSTATGGVASGLDPADISTLQELDDLNYAKRLQRLK